MSDMIINEVWKAIDGYLNYQVSNMGRVRNCVSGRILQPGVNQNGYYFVFLFQDTRGKQFRVHRLVANEFLEKPPSIQNLVVDHIDRNRKNNMITNLRYCTRSQNAINKDKYCLGASSQFKGVSFCKKRKRYRASIRCARKLYNLGYYNTEEEAATAYNKKALEMFGEFARLNEIGAEDN